MLKAILIYNQSKFVTEAMKMKFRLHFILLILILINAMGYDWLHTLWHLRNDMHFLNSYPHPPADCDTKTADMDFNLACNDGLRGCSVLLTAVDDDNLVNNGSPISPDKNSIRGIGCPQVMITWLDGGPVQHWQEPHLPGIHRSVFQPPETT